MLIALHRFKSLVKDKTETNSSAGCALQLWDWKSLSLSAEYLPLSVFRLGSICIVDRQILDFLDRYLIFNTQSTMTVISGRICNLTHLPVTPRICMNREVALDIGCLCPSLMNLMVSVDVKHHVYLL